MSVKELTQKPEAYAHFTMEERYRWLELHENGSAYGYAAIAERDDALELHISLDRWGTKVLRLVQEDLKWLKQEARRLNKKQIMGIRANGEGEFDKNLFRFAHLFGFTDFCVYQTVSFKIE